MTNKRRRRWLLLVVLAWSACGGGGSSPTLPTLPTLLIDAPSARAGRVVHTFSIVARDPKTGDMGVAVASHAYGVGLIVTFAEAGVGVVATQSNVEPLYGDRGLALMRSGISAPKALEALLAADPDRAARQVAFLDATGKVAVHTGAGCIEWAGHAVGVEYSVQANIMVDEKVVPAIAKAFEKSKGELADRLVAALEAGEAAGGDLRGKQSAALVVVAGKLSAVNAPFSRKYDVRIDDHPDPIPELKRQVRIQKAFMIAEEGEVALEKKQWKLAVKRFEAAQTLYPENAEFGFWLGIGLTASGQLELALPFFRRAFAANPLLVDLAKRLLPAGILPDQKTLDRILAEAK